VTDRAITESAEISPKCAQTGFHATRSTLQRETRMPKDGRSSLERARGGSYSPRELPRSTGPLRRPPQHCQRRSARSAADALRRPPQPALAAPRFCRPRGLCGLWALAALPAKGPFSWPASRAPGSPPFRLPASGLATHRDGAPSTCTPRSHATWLLLGLLEDRCSEFH
jgi:hypothetical protein